MLLSFAGFLVVLFCQKMTKAPCSLLQVSSLFLLLIFCRKHHKQKALDGEYMLMQAGIFHKKSAKKCA
jgi:hypothetical protein